MRNSKTLNKFIIMCQFPWKSCEWVYFSLYRMDLISIRLPCHTASHPIIQIKLKNLPMPTKVFPGWNESIGRETLFRNCFYFLNEVEMGVKGKVFDLSFVFLFQFKLTASPLNSRRLCLGDGERICPYMHMCVG